MKLRRGGPHCGVGGRGHGNEHAVNRVVCHVVHLGVDLITVVAGPAKKQERLRPDSRIVPWFRLKFNEPVKYIDRVR